MGEVDGFRLAGRRTVARAAFLTLDRLHIESKSRGSLVRVVVRHPGAVAIVPLDGSDVILIEQYRAPVGSTLLEIPAGKLDVPGEAHEVTAARELEEETGFRAGYLEPLGVIHTTPGFSDEAIEIFVARDLVEVGASPTGAEEETARIVRMPMAQALDGIISGRLTDAKTIAGLYLVSQR